MLDHFVYATLAMHEKNPTLKHLLEELSAAELRHIGQWKKLLGKDGLKVGKPAFIGMRALFMVLLERILGVAFVTRLLERNESRGLAAYGESLDNGRLGQKERLITLQIIEDEKGHEASLSKVLEAREADLAYTQSTLLGLNDGLVEVLAIVAGIASVASSSLIVVVIGMISGISGTLSMAGGVYIASKSEQLVTKDDESPKKTRNYLQRGIPYRLILLHRCPYSSFAFHFGHERRPGHTGICFACQHSSRSRISHSRSGKRHKYSEKGP